MFEIAIKRRQGEFSLDAEFGCGSGITALFGPSGAGKTSVIAAVAGLSRPDSGRIALGGRVLFDTARRLDLPPEKRRLGYVFQDARLFPHLSVNANLRYGMTGKGRISFASVVELLAIEHLLARRPYHLSGGEKQRVAIGRALLSDPDALLMDEPLASLDQARKAEILPYLAELPRRFDLPILYVSHSVEEVLRLADSLVLMEQGRVTASGSVEDLGSRLTGGDSAILLAEIDGQEEADGLTRLKLAGNLLRVQHVAAPLGSRLRLRIHAAEVILAHSRPEGLSVQNMLQGVISELSGDGTISVEITLADGQILSARVTRRALREMGLSVGQPILALIKTASILGPDIARR